MPPSDIMEVQDIKANENVIKTSTRADYSIYILARHHSSSIYKGHREPKTLERYAITISSLCVHI